MAYQRTVFQIKENDITHKQKLQTKFVNFFKNKLFDPENFYNSLIRSVISSYKKKHKDNRIHITFDHMFSHDNYVTLMFTMRVGKQGIPLWFKSFKQEYINKDISLEKGGTIAFNETLIINGIKHVSALFGEKFDLIFLADRWFNSEKILSTIESLGHTYCIRLKKNIKLFIYDNKEGHKIWKWISDLPSHKYHAIVHRDIELYDSKYKTNIAISKYLNTKDPWIIVTNKDLSMLFKIIFIVLALLNAFLKIKKAMGYF